MTPAEYFAAEIAKHKHAFYAGYYPALLDAFALCVMNGLPLPPWVWRPVAEQIERDFAKRRSGSGKRGRTGGKLSSAVMERIHYLRWAWAHHWLANRKDLEFFGHKPTRDGAFEYTSKSLRGTRAQGSRDAIEDSYKKVERARKSGKLSRFEAAGHDLRVEGR
jgi:hypothetical protein